MQSITEQIHLLAQKALDVNQSFNGGVSALEPKGFLPPDKREIIISLLKQIKALSETP